MTDPVMRMWQARIARGDISAWETTFRDRVLDHMRGIEGFQSITVLVDRSDDPCDMTVLTCWDDMHAVRRFAGDAPERTVLPDFMARFFPSYESEARFCDVVLREDRL